ncbi:uncharacterized protein LOC108874171 isoform X10 [Lates calcarifer]|uniref:Uncharacterized protein LOC108874171 isoform X10 n=1 Tax=Lates calcarifer TaxID=8187 RepID=A0AAJ8DMW1_LATCA|nr:uncharacterized protein LOC108874171 isoform X10 [Lates calcarifer]
MEERVCIFLLVLFFSHHVVSGTLVVNVAQTFYQAEENHHITLEWTFTPKTLSSSNIYILCQLITDQKVSKVLFHLHEGVEVSESQDEQFSGRVQFDKDVLREGRLRLHVSRLRTEDSGLYLCEVNTESGSSSDKCRLSVTGNHQITCQTEPNQAEEGGDVSLQCRLDPSVDLRKETLEFTRADLNREDDVVHLYRHEKDQTDPQMDQYRDRTTLIHEDLIRGIISLKISSLTLTDSGLYRCYVPGLAASATITLTVVRKDQDNRTNTTIIEPEKPGAEENKRVGVIVGGVLTVVALILVLILIGVLVKRRNLMRKKDEFTTTRPPVTENTEPEKPVIHQLTCQTEPNQVEEGGDVSLQCRLDPSVDLRKETLEFTRADLNREDDVVHLYRHEKDQTDRQMDQYRDRTTLIHEDLIRGIISLNISSLTLTDSGLYTCYVPGLADSCTITLTVVRKKDEFTTTRPPVTENTEPEKPGAEKMNVGAIVGGVLGLIFFGVVGALLVFIIIIDLVKRRNLWMKKKQEAEKTPNISEMEKLETTSTEGDEELHRAAENASGNFLKEITDQRASRLFHLHEGVEVSESQDEQFSGRVQFDKDVLREGRLRLDVSRLRTEDSGLYLCEVNTESGSSSDKCRLNVTVIHQITCQTEPNQVEEGDVAELQCRLDPSVDLRKETLDFTRADINKEVVHAYRHEKDQTDPQMDQYRDRTTLIHEDLIRGIISLNISSLTLTDSGLYTCYVPGLAASATITLTVVKKDKDNRTNTTIIESEKPGAEKMDVGAIVGGVLGALIGLGLILIGVLVKLGIIRMKKKQEAEKTPNISEMEKLETTSTEGDEELHRAAENASGNFLKEV